MGDILIAFSLGSVAKLRRARCQIWQIVGWTFDTRISSTQLMHEVCRFQRSDSTPSGGNSVQLDWTQAMFPNKYFKTLLRKRSSETNISNYCTWNNVQIKLVDSGWYFKLFHGQGCIRHNIFQIVSQATAYWGKGTIDQRPRVSIHRASMSEVASNQLLPVVHLQQSYRVEYKYIRTFINKIKNRLQGQPDIYSDRKFSIQVGTDPKWREFWSQETFDWSTAILILRGPRTEDRLPAGGKVVRTPWRSSGRVWSVPNSC